MRNFGQKMRNFQTINEKFRTKNENFWTKNGEKITKNEKNKKDKWENWQTRQYDNIYTWKQTIIYTGHSQQTKIYKREKNPHKQK